MSETATERKLEDDVRSSYEDNLYNFNRSPDYWFATPIHTGARGYPNWPAGINRIMHQLKLKYLFWILEKGCRNTKASTCSIINSINLARWSSTNVCTIYESREGSEVVRQVVYPTKLQRWPEVHEAKPWWIGGSMFGLSAEVGVALPASVASWTRRASRNYCCSRGRSSCSQAP